MENLWNTLGLVSIGVVAIALILLAVWPRKKASVAPPVPVAEPAKPPPAPYTHEQFMRDIEGEVAISEILERCQGAFPAEPEQEKPPGTKSEEPAIPAVDPPPESRADERQKWFARLSEVQPKLELIPGPKRLPEGKAVQAWTVPCTSCRGIYPTCRTCNGTGRLVILGK